MKLQRAEAGAGATCLLLLLSSPFFLFPSHGMASLLALPTTSEGNAIRQVVKALVEVRPVEDPRQEEVLKDIAQELERSLADVKARIAQVEAVPRGALGSPKEIRVMLNGCFDIMHAGHYNALRQTKASLAREGVKVILVAGVHSDEAIFEQKGPTVMKDAERRGLVEACKWVDEVAFGLPYLITPELLDKYNCDFVVSSVAWLVGCEVESGTQALPAVY